MDLFDYLKQSLAITPTPGMSLEEEKFWKESTYFRSLFMYEVLIWLTYRIVSITRTWIENYLLFDSADSNMVDPLNSLATKDIENILPRSGDQLRRVLMRKVRNVKNMPVQQDCPSPILPKNLERMKFLELDTLELARQLSIMYGDGILKMNNHELLFAHEQITGGLKWMLSLSKKVYLGIFTA
jgi:son of sevenless-like protein